MQNCLSMQNHVPLTSMQKCPLLTLMQNGVPLDFSSKTPPIDYNAKMPSTDFNAKTPATLIKLIQFLARCILHFRFWCRIFISAHYFIKLHEWCLNDGLVHTAPYGNIYLVSACVPPCVVSLHWNALVMYCCIDPMGCSTLRCNKIMHAPFYCNTNQGCMLVQKGPHTQQFLILFVALSLYCTAQPGVTRW